MNENYVVDVAIVGGGHNGLVAACYLAMAGKSVMVLEKNAELGGATVSQKVFPDFGAKLSRYSYLVSLLPDKIVEDLHLKFETVSRSVASFTPVFASGENRGLLITSAESDETDKDFLAITGTQVEYQAWQDFYSAIERMAQIVAPTFLKPLPTRSELRKAVNDPIWDALVERPLGEVIESTFASDIVRGIVLTDGLIGTFTDAHSFAANCCFLYHLMGNGNGEWKVPKGGMGGLVNQLSQRAESLGVQLRTATPVTSIQQTENGYIVVSDDHKYVAAEYVLANCAPQELARLMGTEPPKSLDGSQMKINMLLRQLPRLKSGIDPTLAFAGTFHFDESYADLARAFAQSSQGVIPDRIPAEMYCHTLTDTSILDPDLVAAGYHTLTLFALHTPASLFDTNHDDTKEIIGLRLLSQLNEYLVDPIEDCLAVAQDGSLCIEIKSPVELEKEIGLPRGNIFHKDLSFPFREDDQPISWGVETSFPNLFICGAGAIRGGGVSGIPGHNAAAAILSAQAKENNR